MCLINTWISGNLTNHITLYFFIYFIHTIIDHKNSPHFIVGPVHYVFYPLRKPSYSKGEIWDIIMILWSKNRKYFIITWNDLVTKLVQLLFRCDSISGKWEYVSEKGREGVTPKPHRSVFVCSFNISIFVKINWVMWIYENKNLNFLA